MANPPTDITPSELFRKLTEAPRPSDVIDYPRKDAEGNTLSRVRLQVLNTAEYDLARTRATDWFKKKFPNADSRSIDTAREILGDRTAKEVLALACLSERAIKGSEENGTPKYLRLFRDANDLDEVTADELTVLWVSQQAIQYRYGPYEGNIESDEQVTAWMHVLVEGATNVPLAAMSWHQLTELCTSLAGRAYSLSVLLGSPSENLQTTLAAIPDSWGLGTYGHGKLPAELTKTSLSRSDLGLSEATSIQGKDAVVGTPPMLSDEPLTAEQAIELSKHLYKQGEVL